MTPNDFVHHLGQVRASAILRTDDADAAQKAMEAAIRGGFSICEFTLTVPDVYELIADFSKRHPDVVFGAGTVLTVGTVLLDGTRVGARCRLGPYAVIGGLPMDDHFGGEASTVVLEDEVEVRPGPP